MTTRRVLRITLGAAAGVAVLSATFALGARYGTQQARARDVWADGRLLSTAIDSVRANALDSLPGDELIRRAVSGMLRELQDPYAALLQPEGYRNYRGSLLGESQGLGLTLRQQGQWLSVRHVAPGSPAAGAGVRRGDRILTWNGAPANDPRLRSTDSTRLKLDHTDLLLLRSPLGDSARVTLRRATWHKPAVSEAGLVDDSIGYVRFSSISQGGAEELEAAVLGLTRRGATSLVLDLRGNGGGLYEVGVKAAGLFLPPDALVSSLAGRGGAKAQEYRVNNSRWPTLPLTVLVDGGTASAAEVIAAALREHGRTVLVGAPTYGKGVVQRVVRLSPDLSLRLTTARWLTPTGRLLERREGPARQFSGGLRPDVQLRDASWRDVSSLPRAWGASDISRALVAADSATAFALREGWSVESLAALEERVRLRVATRVPRTATDDFVPVVTRLATVRVLELRGRDRDLLRYAALHDTAIRNAMSLLQPDAQSAATLTPAPSLR